MLSTDPRDATGGGAEPQQAVLPAELGSNETLLEAAAFAARTLLRADPRDHEVPEVLRRLARAASASHAYIFENRVTTQGELEVDERFVWPPARAFGAEDPPEEPPNPYGSTGGRERTLGSGEVVHGLTSEFAEPERAALVSRKILSIAVVPVFAGDAWWGCLWFGRGEPERAWCDEELEPLRIAADALGGAILRGEAEDAHREAEFRYRSLVEHIPMMATYVDKVVEDQPGHSIPIYISPQVEDMLGYPRDAWLTDDELWLQVLHPDDAERMTKEDEDARRELRPLSAEYRMFARDGRVVWVSEKSTVVKDEETGTPYWQGVMVDITERKRIEEELTRARRKLLHQTVRAEEEERKRLAADLHDGPVQRLTRLAYVLERIRSQLGRGDVKGPGELLDSMQEELAAEIRRLRRMMSELRPPILDTMGLGSALQDHADALSQESNVRCSVDTAVHEDLDPTLETVLYRVAQEALTNVVKHARAEHAWLSLRTEGEAVVLEVRDDGTGFDPAVATAVEDKEHFGLIGMQERAEMAGGRWEVCSTPGAGTTVRVVIPRRREVPA